MGPDSFPHKQQVISSAPILRPDSLKQHPWTSYTSRYYLFKKKNTTKKPTNQKKPNKKTQTKKTQQLKNKPKASGYNWLGGLTKVLTPLNHNKQSNAQ